MIDDTRADRLYFHALIGGVSFRRWRRTHRCIDYDSRGRSYYYLLLLVLVGTYDTYLELQLLFN